MVIKNKDITELLENNVINEEIAENIQNYYNNKTKNLNSEESIMKNNFFFNIISVFGSVLLGLGIIILLAFNWSGFTKNIKTIVSLAPLVITQIIIVFYIIKDKYKDGAKNSLDILLFFTTASSLALISNTYHISGEKDMFFLIWFILTLMYTYINKSDILYLFNGIILYIYWLTSLVNGNEKIILFIILFSILAENMYRTAKINLKKNINNFYVLWAQIFPIILFIHFGIHSYLYVILFIMLLSLYNSGNLMFLPKNANLYSLANIIIFIFVYNKANGNNIDYTYIAGNFINKIDVFKYFVIISLIILLIAKEIKKITKDRIALYIMFFLLVINLFLEIIFHNEEFSSKLQLGFKMVEINHWCIIIISTLIILYIGGMKIVNGIKTKKIFDFNLGIIIISIYILNKFFIEFGNTFFKGIIFVIVGLALILLNRYFVKRVK